MMYQYTNWINQLISAENKVPIMVFEGKKMAGSATCKQSETVLSCVVL